MNHDARVTRCFLAILDFGDVAHDAAAAQDIHNSLVSLLDALVDPQGCDTEALQTAYAMAYPIVALADESAMRASPELSAYWRANTLQVKYFREHAAGDNFFVRLSALSLGSAPLGVLHAYYTALALGFKGRFAEANDDVVIASMMRDVHAALCRRGAFAARPLALAAHAESQAAASGSWGRPLRPSADFSAWTARRSWQAFAAVCIASVALFAMSSWYLRYAAAPTLQLVASVLKG